MQTRSSLLGSSTPPFTACRCRQGGGGRRWQRRPVEAALPARRKGDRRIGGARASALASYRLAIPALDYWAMRLGQMSRSDRASSDKNRTGPTCFRACFCRPDRPFLSAGQDRTVRSLAGREPGRKLARHVQAEPWWRACRWWRGRYTPSRG